MARYGWDCLCGVLVSWLQYKLRDVDGGMCM